MLIIITLIGIFKSEIKWIIISILYAKFFSEDRYVSSCTTHIIF